MRKRGNSRFRNSADLIGIRRAGGPFLADDMLSTYVRGARVPSHNPASENTYKEFGETAALMYNACSLHSWGHVGAALVPCWVVLVPCWGRPGAMLGTPQCHAGSS